MERDEIIGLLPQLGESKEAAGVVDNIIGVLEGEMWSGLDFPHKPHHNLRVLRDAQCISALLNLESWEEDLLDKGAVVHDLGRNFVEMGLIGEEEHQNGSFVLARVISSVRWSFPEDIATHFAEGVALHTEDVLPQNVARWIRVLRDSDRTSRLGVGGIIELAWYLGYRDAYIDYTSAEEIIDDQLLFDLGIPVTPEELVRYDEKPRQYLDENILPFLVKENKLEDLVKRVNVLLGRIYGVPEVRRGKTKEWKVEPVSQEAQFTAAPRIVSMNRFFNSVGLSIVTSPDTQRIN